MPTCLNFDQIFAAGPVGVKKLREVGDTFASADEPGACEAFTRQVHSLESFVKETYRIAILVARKSDDTEEVLQIFATFSSFCGDAMGVLTGLKKKYPYCGTPELYDLTLDYKIACDQRRNNLLAELECPNQLTELFPPTI